MAVVAQTSQRANTRIRTSNFMLVLLMFVTAGYWAFGKAFAYLGLYPIYIGETTLILGLLLLLRFGTIPIPRHGLFWVYVMMLTLTMVQGVFSILMLGQNPMEVFRNMAVIYYGLFAYLTFVLIRRAQSQEELLNTLMKRLLPGITPWILLGGTVTAVGYMFFYQSLPFFPLTDVSVLFYKPTDAVIPLAVILTLWLRGYVPTIYAIWASALILVAGARSRSAMLAAGAAFGLMMWKPNLRLIAAIAIAVVTFTAMLITDVSIDLGYREVSARQFAANIVSLVSPQEAAEFDPTTANNASWRTDWWGAILRDATSNNYILIGSGWGDNLANRYGFQIFAESEGVNVLRNPHNAFIGILARGGWLIAGLWTFFYGVLIYGLWKTSRNESVSALSRDAAWICLIYVVITMINGATDVFLESPQNAIPHWIVIGVAWSLIYRKVEPATDLQPETQPVATAQRRAIPTLRPQPQPLVRSQPPAGD